MLRRSAFLSRGTLATLAILAVLTAIAPTAGAASARATTRVEGLDGTLAPATTVDVPGPATFTDDSPDPGPYSATFTVPVAMGALAVLADVQPFPFTTNDTMTFLNSIAGVGGPPYWASWWLFSVNGWAGDLGAAELRLRQGDSVVFFEVDATAPWQNKQLVVRTSPHRGLFPGQTATINVVGDDLAKANTLTDVSRWSLDRTADFEPASEFQPVSGVTLHVGRRVYDLDPATYADGTVSISDLPRGTYRVWAEKAADGTYNYVRSASVKINVDDGARISELRVSPSPYRAGRRMAIRFRLDKRATVSARIVNTKGRTVARLGARTLNAGSRVLYWSGKTRTALTSHLTVKVQSVDSWSRSVTATTSVRVVR